jgi:hypothetical protein
MTGRGFCSRVFSRFDTINDAEGHRIPSIGRARLVPDNVQRSIEMALRLVIGKMCHELSMPSMVGMFFGLPPAVNVSMIIMREPQHGHG